MAIPADSPESPLSQGAHRRDPGRAGIGAAHRCLSGGQINYSERETMRNVLRLNEPRRTRPVWLSASAVALAAAVAGAAGIAAAPGKAAPARHAAKARHAHKADKFKHPKLKHGVLTIEGTDASDKITLRLQAGDPGFLQVDV
ncbi:MAG: hypothetical protein ACXVZ4_11245, partial [Gaiellaceae bacterium]